MKLIDTNLWLGNWPFAPIAANDPTGLMRKLKRGGLSRGFVSPLDTVFQVDPMPGNRALMNAIANTPFYQALPVVNLATPAWEAHFDELVTGGMTSGVRLLPAYHGYGLSAASVGKLVSKVNAIGMRIVITARLVDERHEHRAVSIKPISVKALTKFVGSHPDLNPLIQGLNRHELEGLSREAGRFMTDTSFAEWEDTLATLKRFLPVRRMVFGSLVPLQSLQAQVDKVRLSSLSSRQRDLVGSGNAMRYFGI